MEFYIDKNTDLMRSTFVTIGLAELLNRLPPLGSGQEVMIQDMGSCYRVSNDLDADKMRRYVVNRGFLPPLLPALVKPLTSKEQKLLDEGTPREELEAKYAPIGFRERGGIRVNYGEQKARADAAKKYKPKKDARDEGDPPRAHENFPVWAHFCSYFGKGSAMRSGYPNVIHAWHAHQNDRALDLWDLIVACYGTFPNQVENAHEYWKQSIVTELDYAQYGITAEVSTLAIISPSTSKGVSAPKGYNMLSEDTPNTFWLEILFAFVGFLKVGMPYNIGSDVVTYYPLPRDIEYNALIDIMNDYRKRESVWSLYRYSNGMGRAKLDVLNHITYYQSMVQHYRDNHLDGIFDAIDGFVGYYYKDVSTQIPFDETVFILPAWLATHADAERLEKANQLLETHRKILSALRGKPPKYQLTSDELTIIEHYRRYITRGDAWDWIHFAIAYGQYRFRNMHDLFLPPLLINDLKESLPVSNYQNDRLDFRPILEDAGFQNIALAINNCTSYAQYKKDDTAYAFKVQHGLGDDLLRNAHDANQFVADLSRFVHEYRRENMRVHANTKQKRQEIEPEHLEAVIALVAQYGSKVVAHLLVASGYAARFGKKSSEK